VQLDVVVAPRHPVVAVLAEASVWSLGRFLSTCTCDHFVCLELDMPPSRGLLLLCQHATK
jgi:hypothetical protein